MTSIVNQAKLTLTLTRFNLRSRYRGTWGGLLWVMINPLAMYGVQSLVFKKFLKLDIPNYFTFLLSGLLPWIFLSMSMRMAPPLIESRSAILKSFFIDPKIFIRGQVIDNFINFILPFGTLMIAVGLIEGQIRPLMIAKACLALVPIFLLSYALTLVLSLLQILYRDTRFVLDFVLSFLYFLTPIFYPRDYIPETFQILVDINLLYWFITPFQQAFSTTSPSFFFSEWFKALSLGVIVVGLSNWLWNRFKNSMVLKL